MKPTLLLLLLIFLAGCAGNSNLTSSFGNRKYTKGYFWNTPTKQSVAVITDARYSQNKPIEKPQQSAIVSTTDIIKTKTAPSKNSTSSVIPKSNVQKKTQAIESVKSIHTNIPPDGDPQTPQPYPTDKALSGFLHILLSILAIALLILMTALPSLLGLGYGGLLVAIILLIIPFLILSIYAVIALIKGIIQCIQALHNGDIHKGFAIAGLALVLLLLLLIPFAYIYPSIQ